LTQRQGQAPAPRPRSPERRRPAHLPGTSEHAAGHLVRTTSHGSASLRAAFDPAPGVADGTRARCPWLRAGWSRQERAPRGRGARSIAARTVRRPWGSSAS